MYMSQILLRVLKAVSNERRIKIIEQLLRHKKIGLAKIAQITNIPVSSTCRHLKMLETNLMVQHQIKNGKVYYSLNPKRPLRFNRNIISLLKKQRKRYKY
ncbi:MAG: winged helix-turn-helix domain-containing protein [Elusimicrobiota bacterium]